MGFLNAMNLPSPKRVVLVSTHSLFAEGFSDMICAQPDWAWVDQFTCPIEAFSQIPLLCPDVVLMEISLPHIGGFELMRRLKKRHPTLRIIMLANDFSLVLVRLAIAQGASGYLLKTQSASAVIASLDIACQGQRVFAPEITEKLYKANLKA